MKQNEYAIHGGDEGQKRLGILSRTLAASTGRFLENARLQPGMRCLDLGCGGGDVTVAIARYIGPHGQVTGIDMDERKIQLARETAAAQGIKNVRFQTGNAYDLSGIDPCDIVYARFLFSHLSRPKAVLHNLRAILRPPGLLLIEDTDFSGHFSYPPSRAFRRYVSLYRQLLKKRGADANIGQKLAGLMRETGGTVTSLQVSQPVHAEGEGKLMAEITMEGISKSLVEEGLVTPEEAGKVMAGIVAFRKRGDTIMSLPRIFQLRCEFTTA